MNIVDLMTTIIVVAVLVTVTIAMATYVANRLRHTQQAEPQVRDEGSWYFVRYLPETRSDERS